MKKKIKKYNVGIVGVGNTGSQHLKFYLKNKFVKKVFAYDLKEIKKIGQNKLIIDKNLKMFSQHKEKNILSISNYDSQHWKFIKKHMKRNHIFVEKPMCRDFSQLNHLYRFYKKNNYKNLITSNLVLRSADLFNKIKTKIKNGEFGEIFYFEADYLYGRISKLRKGWRGSDKNYSVTLGGGIHLFDLMISFFNQIPDSVQSYGNKIATKKDKFSFKDFCQSNFFFKNGAIGKITSNFGCVHNHQHILKIYGSKKTFIYDDNGARIFDKYDPSSSKKIKIKNLYSGKDCLLREFFRNIDDKKEKKIKILNEINLMSVAISSDISLKKGKKMKIKKYT